MLRGCLGGVRGYEGCLGCILCQKRLRLSWKLDECKPLVRPARKYPHHVPLHVCQPPFPELNAMPPA